MKNMLSFCYTLVHMRGFISEKILLFVSIILNIILVVALAYFYYYNVEVRTPFAVKINKNDLPLIKYTYGVLKTKTFEAVPITFGDIVIEETDFISQKFYFDVDGQKASGLTYYPKNAGTYPAVVMFRGFVDPTIYEPGIGTQRAAQELAKKGYVTFAPDFLGYGESDMPSIDPLEERFQTYTTALALLSHLKNVNKDFDKAKIDVQINNAKIGIWAHSNGGQIALTVLEVTGKNYPTVLWAPVSKPFPYSILYYTDEFDDHGRALRRLVYEFEKDYDVEQYSLVNYLDWIKAPIQLHQGGADDAVPQEWSDEFVTALEENKIDVEYFTYPQADHNLMSDWNTAVERSTTFFNNNLSPL